MTAPDSRLPAAARLLARIRADDGVVVIGDEAAPVEVTELLTGGYNVGAVVPGGSLEPLRSGVASMARHDVTDTDLAVLAIAPGVLVGLRMDPELDDPVVVARAVVAHVRAQGLRVLVEPAWRVDAGGPAVGPLPVQPSAAGAGADVLVVTGFLSTAVGQLEDLLVFDLVRSMTEQIVGGAVTVLLTDGFRSEHQVARLRANGVEVVVPPVDPERWLRDRLGRFSHVVCTPSGLQSAIGDRLERTQPQAARILYLPSLPFREVSALAPLTPASEQPSLETVRSMVEARTVEMAAEAVAVWCDSEGDARWVRGVLPGLAVNVVGSPIGLDPDALPLQERRGVMILGALGHDMIKANEDAAAAALDQLVGPLRRRHPDLPVSVVADRPTPFLRHVAEVHGATFVPESDARSMAASCRVIMDLHTYGTGGEVAVRLALEAATPFVAHPVAVGGLELGPLMGAAVFGAPTDLSLRARVLLEDDQRWQVVQAMIQEVVTSRYRADERARATRGALASVGVDASLPAGRWIDGPVDKDERAPHRRVTLPLRPGPTTASPPRRGPVPDDHDGRYQLWAQRHGPTEDVLDDLRQRVASLPYQPTISVLVPVYNTPASLLLEAVDSVRNQVYDRWQLCLADDGSVSAETRATLAALGDDPRIKVVRLAGNSGIAGATNAALDLADGDYVAFLDHDDTLKPHALAQVVRWLNADPSLDLVYSDEDKVDLQGRLVEPHIKPDFSPNMLLTQNYICHLMVLRRSLLAELGGLRTGFDGSQDHDLVLRAAERTDRIAHIPEPLYTWRIIPGSTSADIAAKPYATEAGKRAVGEAVARRGHPGTVEHAPVPGMYRTRYHRFGRPRVGIVIPTRDRLELLEPCIRSVVETSTYDNYEILVVDNQSTDAATLAYLARFPGRVLRYDHPFSYARMMNAAARSLDTDVLLFLNNDTTVITPTWIEEMLEHAMRREVGAVGPRLYFRDGRVQHEGILVGQGGWATNVDHNGYWARGEFVRDTSAVTGAATMMRSSVYWRLGGNDERLRVAYNDVDICLRAHQAGYEVVYTPYAELYHYEGASRAGHEHHEDGPQFGIRWRPAEGIDPYYNPMFDPKMPLFRIRL